MKKILFMLSVAACGGVKTPPTQFSIDPSFTTEERVVILDALSAWCDNAGWCPEETADLNQGGFIREPLEATDFECPEGNKCFIAGENRGEHIAINETLHDLETLWITVAHEIGHYCIEGHSDVGLMSDYYQTGDSMEVDAVAVGLWEQGCD